MAVTFSSRPGTQAVNYVPLNELYSKRFPIHIREDASKPVELSSYTNLDHSLLGVVYRDFRLGVLVAAILERDPADGIFYGVHTQGPFKTTSDGVTYIIQELCR